MVFVVAGILSFVLIAACAFVRKPVNPEDSAHPASVDAPALGT
jgi:DHA2 family lincomycin resistance protein-like MFS transporter